jgi:Domain of unknown function (DUF5069)
MIISLVMNTTISLPKAKDLMQEPPRSPRERIHNYVIMARMIDKGRATLNGTNGEYHFNCPVDNMLFGFKGIDGEEVRKLLLSGANDEEVAEWIDMHGAAKTPEEIKNWSDTTEQINPYNDPEKREWFTEECRGLGLDPAHTTLFEYLEADDRASHKILQEE